MQNEQEFYRCLVSDAAGRTLKKILEIIRDDTLSDEICFHKIEAIISLYEELGISTGSRHDFGYHGSARRCRALSHSSLLPQGTVPTAGTWGAFFSGKEPAPHPGRKAPGRFDFALNPQRHKGRGPRPPPLETNSQGDEGRETRIKQETN